MIGKHEMQANVKLEGLYEWEVMRGKKKKGRNGSEELFINGRHRKRH